MNVQSRSTVAVPDAASTPPRGLGLSGYLTCFRGIVWREVLRFLHQRERFFSALVRPLIWLFIFAAGFRQVLGVSIIPPYESYVLYEEFIAPGLIGIAKDTLEDLEKHLGKARDADIVVTIGGASVGDHDLVHKALSALGVTLDFWKIAMRPGKPMMFGRKGRQRFIGLPGNPVSALICAEVFLMPLVRRLSGGVAETASASNVPAKAN